MKTPLEFADAFVSELKLPQDSAGRGYLPVPYEHVREIISRAITQDRGADKPDFEEIMRSVVDQYTDGELVPIDTARNLIVAALNYAQASGTRFKGISEADYDDACRAGFESFCSTLKDKGLWG